MTIELRGLIEEKHAAMRKAHCTGSSDARATTDQCDRRCRVMWRLERSAHNHRPFRTKRAVHRVDRGDLEDLLLRQRRKKTRQPFGQQAFTGPWCAVHQQVVTASCSHLNREPRRLLAVDVTQVEFVVDLAVRHHGLCPARACVATQDVDCLCQRSNDRDLRTWDESRLPS
jgi:hypothetical protein